MKNPFRPTFGIVPMALAGREDIIDDIMEGLDNGPGDPNRSSIFVGARGTGKTVTMTKITELAEEMGWISVNVTSGTGILAEIPVQIREKAKHILKPESVKRISSLMIAGAGVSFDVGEERTTWRSELTRILEELDESGIGMLITIDEVSPDDEELKAVISDYQHFLRERRNVAMLMAGLPGNVSALLLDKKVSFVRRAFRYNLEAIGITDVAYAMDTTIKEGGRTIGEEALWYAAEQTEGFAFMIQLIGYHMWRQNKQEKEISIADVKAAMEYARRDMERSVVENMMMEMTEKEKDFVIAMAIDEEEDSATITISDRMGVSPNNATHLRKRLIERGVIIPKGRGKVAFAQSIIKDYVRRNYLS